MGPLKMGDVGKQFGNREGRGGWVGSGRWVGIPGRQKPLATLG